MSRKPNDFIWTVAQAARETGRHPQWIRDLCTGRKSKAEIRYRVVTARLWMVSESDVRAADARHPRRRS